jgi:hypothetical protein
MPRPQFSLKSLLWLMAVVAAFFAGTITGRRHEAKRLEHANVRVADKEARVDSWLKRFGIEESRMDVTYTDDSQ